MTPTPKSKAVHITQVIREALEMANFDNLPTYFKFNGVWVRVMPGETQKSVEDRWYLGTSDPPTPDDFNNLRASTPVMPVWML